MGIISAIIKAVFGDSGNQDEHSNSVFAPGGPFSDPGGDMAANRELQEQEEQQQQQHPED